jgi:hypothetical protein
VRSPDKNSSIQSANGIGSPANGRRRVFCWTEDRSSCKHRIPAMSFAAFVVTPTLRGHLHRRRGWLAYVLAWMALALLWSVTAAASSGMPPGVTLRFGFVIMGTAGALGVGVWWLTGRLPWDRRSLRFYAVHACSAVLYALSYSSATLFLELLAGRFSRGLASSWTSGVLGRMGVPLQQIADRLEPAQFVRVHRSHIVNMDHVASLSPYDGSRIQVRLRNGTLIVASRQCSRALRELGAN